MIVVGPNYTVPHFPSKEEWEREKAEEQHAREVMLWALRRRKQMSKNDIIDRYEVLVEHLGVTRKERHAAVANLDWPMRGIWYRLQTEGLIVEKDFLFSLTAAGKALPFKKPRVPEWFFRSY